MEGKGNERREEGMRKEKKEGTETGNGKWQSHRIMLWSSKVNLVRYKTKATHKI